MRNLPKNQQGFSLIELLVVMAVFTITVLIVIGIFFTLTSTQRRLASAIVTESDVRYILEYMAQEIRNDSIDYDFYYLTTEPPIPVNIDLLVLRDRDHSQIQFQFNATDNTIRLCTCDYPDDSLTDCFTTSGCNKGSGTTWQDISSSKVKINDLSFYITPYESPFGITKSCDVHEDCFYGACVGEESNEYCETFPHQQPRVTIVIAAESTQVRPQEVQEVNLQSTITSRYYYR